MNYQVDHLFPTAVYVADDVQIDCDNLRDQAINLDPSLWAHDKEHHYCASDNHVLDEYSNKYARDVILAHVSQYISDVLQYDIPDQCDLAISDSWFTSTNETSDVSWHTHAHAFICGILCLDTIGQTHFQNRYRPYKFWNFGVKQDNPYTTSTYTIPSINGRLMLWQSDLHHRLTTDQQRYSLAFNIMPRGQISDAITARLTI
jgi:hypothetical protein